MAFLRRDTNEESPRRLDGGLVSLRHPEAKDYAAWSALRGESRTFLQPWEPTWSDEELSRNTFRNKLRRYAEDIRDGRAFPFFAFRASDHAFVGAVSLSRVQRGVAQSCAMGYWVGQRFARQGLTLAAVRAVTRFAFEDLGLHRVEAACQPDNAPSKALLEKAGFSHEGFARKYLKINGDWRDHLLYARLSSDGEP
jgi:[ribosomal protein S5]-alanine N-acetyltransferase